jgi:Elongation factor Tu GTP binding domain
VHVSARSCFLVLVIAFLLLLSPFALRCCLLLVLCSPALCFSFSCSSLRFCYFSSSSPLPSSSRQSLGVNQLIVACNKMDTCEWSEARYTEIQGKLTPFLRQTGYRRNVRYVPCSGFTGENLTERSAKELDWYEGPTLVEAIDAFRAPSRLHAKPFRLCIADIYKELALGRCIQHYSLCWISLFYPFVWCVCMFDV